MEREGKAMEKQKTFWSGNWSLESKWEIQFCASVWGGYDVGCSRKRSLELLLARAVLTIEFFWESVLRISGTLMPSARGVFMPGWLLPDSFTSSFLFGFLKLLEQMFYIYAIILSLQNTCSF